MPQAIPAELIQTELEKILASHTFCRADRPSRFLRFVVEHTVRNDGTTLKEYPIGVAVLERGESFDPRVDPIVRVEAGRLRSRLKEYYEKEGRDDPVVIELLKGSYAPVFQVHPRSPEAPHETTSIPPLEVGNRAPLRRRGFLIAAVIGTTGLFGVAFAVWKRRPTASEPIRSLAVLPLANLSGDPNQEYLADGLTEALITELGGIEALRVISRTSVMQYKGTRKRLPEIARELKADGVMEGGVLRAGDRVRITMKLIHAGSERQLWTETYDRSISNVLSLHGEVAQAVRAEVREKLAGHEGIPARPRRPVAPEAVDAYLKARYWANKRTAEGLKKAIEYYGEAIAADPSYARAHSGLGDAYLLSIAYNVLPGKEYFPKIRTTALQALKLDDALADPHLLLAAVKASYEWDWPGAEREHRRALLLEPGSATAHQRYALLLTKFGRFEEALAGVERAQELDPLSPILDGNEGEVLYYARQFQRATDYMRSAVNRHPQIFQGHGMLGELYVATGRYPEAIGEFQTAISLGGWANTVGKLGHVYAVSGKRTQAMKILRELEHSGLTEMSYDIAIIYAGLGDKDRAFAWLERSYDERSRSLTFLRVAPVLDSLRDDRRFSDLLRRRFQSRAE